MGSEIAEGLSPQGTGEPTVFVSPERAKAIELTPYQLSQVLLFRGCNGRKLAPFSAVGGALSEEEKDGFEKFSQRVLDEEITCFTSGYGSNDNGFTDLLQLAQAYGEDKAARSLKKLQGSARLTWVTQKDITTPADYARLPLMTQLALVGSGEGLFGQTRSFLEEGGVMTHLLFTKPAPNYLTAIEDNVPGATMMEKVTNALAKPSLEVDAESHEFTTVFLIPPQQEEPELQLQENFAHLTVELNQGIDQHIEKKYAKMVLFKTMLAEEMRSALFSMVGVTACLPLLHWINQGREDNLLAQSLVKFIPPFLADMVTFGAQLGPWLEGDTFLEKAKDFVKKLGTTHRRSLLLSVGATAAGSALTEFTAKELGDVPAAVVYGLIPLLVAGSTTLDTLKSLRERLDHKDVLEAMKVMFKNNPAHLGIDIGALTTFFTSVAVLGYGGQLHNPVAIALIEGAEEHTMAALITKMQVTFGTSYRFNVWAQTEVEDWVNSRRAGWKRPVSVNNHPESAVS